MKNRKGIIFLTVIITLISLYQLSFTLKSRSIEKEVAEEAQNSILGESMNDSDAKQAVASFSRAYKDSIRDRKVYDLGFKDFTYAEVNKNKLKLGLDLQGGMLITLIVSPDELLKSLSGNNPDEDFIQSLAAARTGMKSSQDKFTSLFYNEFKSRKGEGRLADIFMTESNQYDIKPESSDNDILKILEKEVDDALDRSRIVLENRLNKYGSSQPIIQTIKSSGRIEIQMPGVDDEDRIKTQLNSVAKLEFLEVWHGTEIQSYIEVMNDYLVQKNKLQKEIAGTEPVAAAVETEEEEAIDELFADSEPQENTSKEDTLTAGTNEDFPFADYFQLQQMGNGDIQFYAKKRNYNKIKSLFAEQEFKNLLPADLDVLWDTELNKSTEGNEEGLVPVYFVKRGENYEAPLTGDNVVDARQDFDQQGRVAVSMTMSFEGARIWEQLTKENVGQRIAVSLDDVVYTAPNVNEPIPNGSSVITGNFDVQEAQDLSNILKAGKLPAPTEIERMVTVGPSLGQESIQRGLLSLACGLVLVIIFMVMYYSKGGLVANLALLFNIFFIIGILCTPAIEAALTLPGIAGIVLTIGMSIDANVLIFERIREELALGKPINVAIANGYQKAFTTIIDSNATTLITGIILFVFGSALVKGFAITLIIGIVCSFFTAVFITRLIVELMTRKKGANVSFTTGLSKKLFQGKSYNFIAKRKVAYLFSAVLITIGIASYVLQGGLNLGVAFKGGYSYVVEFNEAVSASDVKSSLKSVFKDASTEVKTFDGDNKLKITTSYLVDSDDKDAASQVKSSLLSGLSSYQALNPTVLESVVVSSTIADDIKNTSIKSTLFALGAIFLYIIFRFRKWQFGLGAIAALLHDVLVVFSVFSITRWLGIAYEIDEVFIGALLTVVGYSINDTVVVFDRVREFLAEKKEQSMADTLNASLNSTLSRTLMTSVTTLLVVVVLFIFGGEALKGFSYALLIGVLIGTYSSIFIATPVVLDASKKQEIK